MARVRVAGGVWSSATAVPPLGQEVRLSTCDRRSPREDARAASPLAEHEASAIDEAVRSRRAAPSTCSTSRRGARAGARGSARRGGRRARGASAGTPRAGSRSRLAAPGIATSARRDARELPLESGRSPIGSHWNGVQGFGTNGLIDTRMRPTARVPPARSRAADLRREVDDAVDVGVGLGREPDHHVELERLDAARRREPFGGARGSRPRSGSC
jgi:hypothetical protein